MRAVQCNLFGLLLASGAAKASPQYNLSRGVTAVSHDIYNLHMTMIWICAAIGLIVFGIMLYSMIYHRKSRGVKPAHFHEHLYLELAWTIVPLLILVIAAIPGTIVLAHINDMSKADLTIKITGYQWKWRYDYLDYDVHFFSNISTPANQQNGTAPKGPHYLAEVDHPLILPVNKKVRFIITSNDVIHSWWVPAFGVKRDAVPGFITEAWARPNRVGVSRGQCAELCGINHAFMPIVVETLSQKGFDNWIAQQKGIAPAPPIALAPAAPSEQKITPTVPASSSTKDELLQKGQQIYQTTCAVCHKEDGTGMPPIYPALKGSAIATGPVEGHINIVMNGKPGTAMQAFKDQFSDEEIAAVITYERNSWGNNKNDVVQALQVKQMRK